MANLVFDFLHSYETGERRESEPANAYQYDEGHVLEAVLPEAVTSCEIHYWIRGQEKSEAYTPGSITQNDDGSCTVIGNIPNLYFETNGELRVYIVVTDGSASITTYEGYVHICQRSMPDDYVDDDPENEATRVLTEAQEAAATATAAAETCEEVLESIPEDYSQLSEDVDTLKDGLLDLRGGVPANVRKSIYTLIKHSLFTDTGLTDEKAIIKSWADEVSAVTLNQSSASISGAGTVQLIATTTPSGGTIVWQSSDESIATVTSYGLVTSVNNGTATITASCGDISASCEVSVSGFAVLTSIEATYTQSGAVYENDTLDSLREDLVVVAYYDDSSTREIQLYTLSGTLEVGTSAILVEFGGKTDTFNVSVDYGVPEGYTRYDYVKNNSTNTSNVAVFTGLNQTYGSNNYEHYLETVYESGTNTAGGGLFGLRKQSGTRNNSITIWTAYKSAGLAGYSLDLKGGGPAGFNLDASQKHTMRITYNSGNLNFYLDGDLIYNGEAGTFDVGNTNIDFALFKAQTGSNRGDSSGYIGIISRIYKYSVKDLATGEYVAYMIPCKNANNESGFYDAIRQNFYTAYGGASNLTALND